MDVFFFLLIWYQIPCDFSLSLTFFLYSVELVYLLHLRYSNIFKGTVSTAFIMAECSDEKYPNRILFSLFLWVN